jgi:hypothetical protein
MVAAALRLFHRVPEADMSDLLIRLRDVGGKPLDGLADVMVSSPQSNQVVAVKKDVKGTQTVKVTGLTPLTPYLVRVFPVRHRPVGQFVRAPGSGSETVQFFLPVDPERVTAVTFPAYAELDGRTQNILHGSALEVPAGVGGQALYDVLPDVAKAGLLNLVAKMGRTALPGGSTVLDHVVSLYRLRGDRLFADVTIGLRDLVLSAVGDGVFRLVSGSLHTPPPDFQAAGSFKTLDPYGNLQVTFFSSVSAPLRFKADVDIDDAGGIAHIFQVLAHSVTGAETHPYDIHEILVFHQLLDPGYRLRT